MLKFAPPFMLLLAATPSLAAPDAALPFIGTDWRATTLAGTAVPPDAEITLVIDGDLRASGNGGCNSYFSEARITATSFSIGNISRSQRSCLYDRNMLEKGYLDALRAATSWSMDSGTLTLLDSGNKPLIEFER